VTLRNVAVEEVVEIVDELLVELIAVGGVTAGFEDEVGDIESETGVAEAGFLVEKALAVDTADVAAFADSSFEG
jgi:hypothetical protein